MKAAIKSLIRILLALISNVLAFIKEVAVVTLIASAVICVVTALAPFIPFILLIFKYFEYRSLKLEILTSQAPKQRVIEPVNKFNYEQPATT